MKQHVHAALIKLWADGAKIEYQRPTTGGWVDVPTPMWDTKIDYRVKCEQKATEYLYVYRVAGRYVLDEHPSQTQSIGQRIVGRVALLPW